MPFRNRNLSNIIGFDDAPFPRDHCGPVKVVGAVFARLRFDGVLIGEVEKDGCDAGAAIANLVGRSKFAEHAQLILLQGISLAGFNVVDVFKLNRSLDLPILVVARKAPDMGAVRRALISHIPRGRDKWAIIEKLGPMEPIGGVHVQRVGISKEQAASVIGRFAIHSRIPEPIRVAHLIAGALSAGQSRGNP